MIKRFNEFVNEKISKNDVYPFILKGVLDVMKTHKEDSEYVVIEKDGTYAKIEMSSINDKPMSELENVVTFFIMPDNFTPNVGIGLENVSYKKDVDVTKFQFTRDEKISSFAKDFYKDIKSNVGFGDITTIYLTAKY